MVLGLEAAPAHREQPARGLALKGHNLRHLQETRPDIGEIRTWNAEVNTHMVAVNEVLGFRAVERLGEFQKHLGAR